MSRWGASYLRFAAAARSSSSSSSSNNDTSSSLSPLLALAAVAAVGSSAFRGFSPWHAALFRALGSEPSPVMPAGWQQPVWASAPKTPPPCGGGEEEEEGEEGDEGEELEEEATAALWARKVLPLLPGAGCTVRDPVGEGRALSRVYSGLLAAEEEKAKGKRKG